MTTKQAFAQLTAKRGWYKGLGFERVTASTLKRRFMKNELSIEKMEEILTLAGYKVVQEKLWNPEP